MIPTGYRSTVDDRRVEGPAVTPKRHRPLTALECATITQLGRGMIFKEIALGSGVAISTAKTWALRAYRKLGARTAAHAVRIHSRAHRECGPRARNRERTTVKATDPG